ncbi:PIG-L family deacetylase [Streptomyces sp. BI20]|uniref:PIG-L family deacetylase n=1 Tax=Streptomyces sp. BI20 TaxID=3403460 RepID=UPI003C741E6C
MLPAHRIRIAAALTVVATATGGVLALAYGNDTSAAHVPAGSAASAAAATRASVTAGSVVQIVAHPDDDLYFMNPDLSQSLRAGLRVTTTYLTSGEADGRNEAHSAQLKDPVRPADRPAYAEARQNGIRSAYALMATGDRTSPWRRETAPTAGGGTAEVDVLVAEPRVNLVWMQLRESRSISGDAPVSLPALWNGRTPTLPTLLTSGTPVTKPSAYTRDQLVDAIAGVLRRYQPTTVRTQDPSPGMNGRTKKFIDHQDHIYGARFAQAALARYAQVKDRPHFTVQSYVGYLNSYLPPTLPAQTAATKLNVMKSYAWSDRQDWCKSPAGCGDRKVAARPQGNHWTQAMRYARADTTSWLVEGAPDHLTAFTPVDGQVGVWRRPGPNAPWSGPTLLPGTGMDAGVTALRLPDRRIAVLGTRTDLGTRGTDYRREVVLSVQNAPDGAFGPWTSLGTPETSDAWTSAISAPTALVDDSGRLTVVLRDSARTLRARAQLPTGGWGPWQRLGGANLQGDPIAAHDARGHGIVFSATPRGIAIWTRPNANAPLKDTGPNALPAPTGPLTAVPETDGVRLYFRQAGAGTVRTTLVRADGPRPTLTRPADLGGQGGYGAVAATGTTLTGRAGTPTVATAPAGGAGAWTESPLLYTGAPAATTQADGTTTTTVLGLDATLHTLTTPTPTWHQAVPNSPLP